MGTVHWKTFEKFLFAVGCTFESERGDHRKYKKVDILRPLIVPRDKSLPEFIVQNNLRTLGISKAEYLKMMERLK